MKIDESWNSKEVPERVAERAYRNAEIQPNGCWLSKYSVGTHGYAQIGWSAENKVHTVLAHRASWVQINGQMPVGMTLDHICKKRTCVNPEHLRVLSNFENARRTSGRDFPLGECANGHPNSRLTKVKRTNKKEGTRYTLRCSECTRIKQNAYRAAKREASK